LHKHRLVWGGVDGCRACEYFPVDTSDPIVDNAGMKTFRKALLVFGAIIFATQAHALMYFARPYDPNAAHWLARDPIGERGGANLYGYVGNDPVNNVDPVGLYVQYTTSSGITFIIGENFNDLIQGLQNVINSGNQITELKISGHGDDDLISLDPYGDYILTATANGILTGDGQDITQFLNNALAKDATVYLNGCHTARGNENLARQMSRLLPGRTIAGQRGFALGLTGNIGYSIHGERFEIDIGGLETLPAGRVIGRKGYYQNGNLISKGWLW
jgi:RHS repeat-associated protein